MGAHNVKSMLERLGLPSDQGNLDESLRAALLELLLRRQAESDLLETAKALLERVREADERNEGDYYAEQYGGYPEHFFNDLRAAIAKAEGKQ